MNNYKQIINKLIKKSFPSLKGKRIYISHFFISRKYSGGSGWILPFLRFIFINKKRKLNKNQLIGLFVHELCHFEVFQKRGWFKSLFFGIKYWVSQDFRKKEEMLVEKLTIKKGYAKEYSLLTKKRNQKFDYSKYYMPSEEIKSYAKKIGKW